MKPIWNTVRRHGPVLAAVAAACGGGSGSGADPTASAGACFVASTATFASFRSWTSYQYTAPADVGGGTHVAGPRTEYINNLPPHGSDAFPQGTVIVKDIAGTSTSTHHIFATVKRGCGFNPAGATGWEWFELTESTGSPTILWRGAAPPPGEGYDTTGNGDCNSCHLGCDDNDYVCSDPLRLKNF